MIITIAQILIAVFGFVCLYCEVSEKYRDCVTYSSVNLALMVMAVVISVGLGVFSASAFIVQLSVLGVTAVVLKVLYQKVLKRQLKIKDFRLKKFYLGDFYDEQLDRK